MEPGEVVGRLEADRALRQAQGVGEHPPRVDRRAGVVARRHEGDGEVLALVGEHGTPAPPGSGALDHAAHPCAGVGEDGARLEQADRGGWRRSALCTSARSRPGRRLRRSDASSATSGLAT